MKKRLLAILIALLMIVGMLPAVALAEDEHVDHDDITFTKWTESTKLPDTEGNYVLTEDVTLSGTWDVPTGETNLCLNGHVIKMGEGVKDKVIKVPRDATLNLYDCDTTTEHYFMVDESGLWKLTDTKTETTKTVTGGVITGGIASDGGGVYVDSGSFTMNGGTICGNTATYFGGGVYNADGSIIMKNGSICGNTAKYGGGVRTVYGNFTMEDGSISENTAENGGGVYAVGSFTMKAGNITENTSNNNGGGVYNEEGTFTMEDGSITGNTAAGNGGGVYNSYGNFTMKNGSISGNTAEKNGGGVFNDGMLLKGVCFGSIIMENGSITENTALCGGGVYNDEGSYTVKNGSITGNTADYVGGIQNVGTLAFIAGKEETITITGNTATGAEGGMSNWGTMSISGKVIIKENTCTQDDYPQNFATNNPITIAGALTGSEIYVTHANMNSDEHDTGVLTSGYSTQNPDAGLNDFFHYEGPYYAKLNDNNEIEVVEETAYQVSVDKGISNGTVKTDFDRAKADETVTLTVTPAEGYQLTVGSLKVNNTTDGITDKGEGKYEFTMPAADVTVTAAFEAAAPDIEKVKEAAILELEIAKGKNPCCCIKEIVIDAKCKIAKATTVEEVERIKTKALQDIKCHKHVEKGVRGIVKTVVTSIVVIAKTVGYLISRFI